MITGFNTDIEHDGVVYHVQTEDKGLETPLILSLVYVGGAILASKRTLYKDLIAEGFSDEVLAERLKRQHRLICAAINSGRINDLKKMGAREDVGPVTSPLPPPPAPEAPPPAPEPPPVPEAVVPTEPLVTSEPDLIIEPDRITEPDSPPVEQDFVIVQSDDFIIHEEEAREAASSNLSDIFDMELEDIPSQIWSPPEREEPPPAPPEPEVVEPELLDSAFDDVGGYGVRDASLEEGLSILLLDEHEFYSGETRILRVLVVNRKGTEERPLGSVVVSIKILGTTFRPLIYS